MDKIKLLLLVLPIIIAMTSSLQQKDKVYNVLVVTKNNSNLFQEAKGLLKRTLTFNGNWTINFIEYRDIVSPPKNILTFADTLTQNNTVDGIIFEEISKTTCLVSQFLKSFIPTIGLLAETGQTALVRISKAK